MPQLRRRRARLVALPLAFAISCASGGGEPRLRTHYDDKRVGHEAANELVERIGLLDDAILDAYVTRIGESLLPGLRSQRFEYSFEVLDMAEPNAFALPGGYIYVTRGLLAMANDQDELACVLGHEIVHSESRHAARRQALKERENPIARRWRRAMHRAAFSREMEAEADREGQRLCAAAGFDPIGMSTLMGSLERAQRMRFGFTRDPSFFDTHPGPRERRAVNAARAGKLAWTRDPDHGDPHIAFLARIQGIDVGQRPESGMVIGHRFLHPIQNFQISFPAGWNISSTGAVVGAQSPDAGTLVFLVSEPGETSPEERAGLWFEELEKDNVRVAAHGRVMVSSFEAWRLDLSGTGIFNASRGHATFFSYGDRSYRVIGVAPTRAARRQLARVLTTTRSFRPLSDENRATLQAQRLRVVEALPGEALVELGQRTGDSWGNARLAFQNALFSNHVFEGGELVKIAKLEPYDPGAP